MSPSRLQYAETSSRLTRGRHRHRRPARRGAVVVEFAILAPFFFLVILGSIEFVRLSMLRNLAQDAAYEAARFVMVEGATGEEAIAKADDLLRWLGVSNSQILVNQGSVIDPESVSVSVSVTIPWSGNTFVPMGFTEGRAIRAEVELARERLDR